MRISSRRVCVHSSVWFDSEGHVVKRIGGERRSIGPANIFSAPSWFFWRGGGSQTAYTQTTLVVDVVVVVHIYYIYIYHFRILNISSRNRSQLLYFVGVRQESRNYGSRQTFGGIRGSGTAGSIITPSWGVLW